MNIKLSSCILLFWTTAAVSEQPARLAFFSGTDFTDISVSLKKADIPDPAYIEVSVKLSPEAEARTKFITMLAYQRFITLYVDGYQLNTSKVQSPLGGQFSLLAPRALVMEWIPKLLPEAVASQPTM